MVQGISFGRLIKNVAKIRPDSERYEFKYLMYMLMLLNACIVKDSADTAKAALGMERVKRIEMYYVPQWNFKTNSQTLLHPLTNQNLRFKNP